MLSIPLYQTVLVPKESALHSVAIRSRLSFLVDLDLVLLVQDLCHTTNHYITILLLIPEGGNGTLMLAAVASLLV